MPDILKKLDEVSGDLFALDNYYSRRKNTLWSKEDDDLLLKNPEVMKKWKGKEAAELRKKYLQYKPK